MTAYRACNGKIEIGAGPAIVGELTAWDANAVADEIDTSAMGDCTASSVAGVKKTTGTVTCNYDYADAGQLLFDIGEKPQLIIYPLGDLTSGLPIFTATEATILQNNMSAEVNGVVTLSMSYSINGEFVETATP
jgi:hypothetical protein